LKRFSKSFNKLKVEEFRLLQDEDKGRGIIKKAPSEQVRKQEYGKNMAARCFGLKKEDNLGS